jgi:hypothetical protein
MFAATQTPDRQEAIMTTTTTTKTCGFCGRQADAPRIVIRNGAIDEGCVGEAHEPHIVPGTDYAAWVERARAAGLTGKW